MLESIVRWSLGHRFLVLLGTVAFIGLGFAALSGLAIDAFPDTTPVQVQINTVATALTPEEVERQITFPIEQSLGGLTGVEEVRSISKFGLSQIVVIFRDGLDIYFARQQVSERLTTAELPPGVSRPKLGPVATGLGEVLHYAVTGKGKSLEELRTIHDWTIKPALRTVQGVAEINSWGGLEKQYQIRVDPESLINYHLTFPQVIEAVQANNLNVGGGNLRRAGEELLIQGVAVTTNIEQIASVVIASRDGRPIRVQDIAEVREGHEIRRGAVTANGRGEVVLGLGFMLMGENSHEVTRRLNSRLDEIAKTLPEDVKILKLYDRTELVDHVIDTVRSNLFEGGLLVIAVLFIFLGNLRAGLIVAIAIPLSMLFAFTGMWKFGIAGSLLSLGALDFGLVVDSSVVLVENVVRHFSHGEVHNRNETIAEAAIEVRRPTLFGELIIMTVYLPILTLEGVEGKLFRPMALTVIFALVGSLIFSLTLIPVLCSLVLPKRIVEVEPLPIRVAAWIYRPFLRLALYMPMATIGFALCCLAIAGMIGRSLGSEFIPRLSEGAIAGNVVRLAGTDVAEVIRLNTLLERRLLTEFPDEIEQIWCRCGTAEVATDPMGIELTDFFISLKPRSKWKHAKATSQAELMKLMEDELEDVPGQKLVFSQPIEQRVNEMATGSRTDIVVKIFGDDFATLVAKAGEVEKMMSSIPGHGSVGIEQIVGQPVLQIRVRQDQLARYGIPARQVLDLVESLGSKPLGEVTEGQLRFPLVVRLPERYRGSPEAFATIVLTAPNGERVPMSQLVEMKTIDSPSTITREWGRRRITVTCNVVDRDQGSFIADLRAKLENWKLPSSRYRYEISGQFEQLERARTRLLIVVPVALLLIFVLLFMTYDRFSDALLVFSGVPFAAVGGIISLWVRDLPFSISAGVGFIALSGVSVLGEMVLVSCVRQLLDQGMALREAVYQAAMTRLRPVLVTALVASLGFLPMALSEGMGAEVQRPLATVVIGGVVSSTLLTLLVLPALYALFGSGGSKSSLLHGADEQVGFAKSAIADGA